MHEALQLSQRLGMLGARPIIEVIEQARAFVVALDSLGSIVGTGPVVDVGSGGGVPGLVIAWLRPDLDVVLVERRSTRADHLRRLVARLRLRTRVLDLDAKDVASALGPSVPALTARGFGPPLALLEVADATLAPGALLIVSEPPWDLGVDHDRAAGGEWRGIELAGTGFLRLRSPDSRVAVLQRRASHPADAAG